MNTEQLGIDLGNLIVETSDESTKEIEDIINPLGTMNMILFEYVALLLWLATQEESIWGATNVLPEEPCKRATNVAFNVVFNALNKIDELRDDPEFNMSKFQDFIHDRFDHYCAAWTDCPTFEGDEEGDENFRRYFNLIVRFIFCCFADKAKFLKLTNEDNNVITNVLSDVCHHSCIFVERVRSVLSRY